ncbi:protein PGR [Rutidosis leptorrhynchoides]|uniref:protein PGR n=1 Tax=Rutidosis leptorrhynchoides TaxID=125765 RepID=UPI003A9A281A
MENQMLQLIIAVAISSFISINSYRKKSLDVSGALAGFFVMAVHLSVNYRFGAMLLAFFFTSSKLTKMGEDRKRSIDADFKAGGQRNWIQVFSNSGIATVLVIAYWKLKASQDTCLDSKESRIITCLVGGLIGHYSCSNGDTWSSELGVLSDDQPRLITNFKHVRRGTNGGVTKAGLQAAAAAGAVIGLAFVIPGLFTKSCTSDTFLKQLLVVPVSAVAGLAGSLIDSILGATLQFSGFCSVRNKVVSKPGPTVKKISGLSILDNNGVNVVSILLTSMLTSFACLYIF